MIFSLLYHKFCYIAYSAFYDDFDDKDYLELGIMIFTLNDFQPY